MSQPESRRFATGDRVRIDVSRGWHSGDYFRKSSGKLAGRVLAETHGGKFVAVVTRDGRVWPTCNPVCVHRADGSGVRHAAA